MEEVDSVVEEAEEDSVAATAVVVVAFGVAVVAMLRTRLATSDNPGVKDQMSSAAPLLSFRKLSLTNSQTHTRNRTRTRSPGFLVMELGGLLECTIRSWGRCGEFTYRTRL